MLMGYDYSYECFDRVWEKDVYMNIFGLEINLFNFILYNNMWFFKVECVLDNDMGFSVD